MPTKPTIAAPFAASGDKNTIPTASQAGGVASLADGFPAITEQPIAAGGLPPQRKDFNGILYLLSQFAFYQQSGGMFEWTDTLDYTAPAMVVGSNGKLYLALLPSGPTTTSGGSTVGAKDPTLSPTYWIDYAASILAELSSSNIAYLDATQAWTRQHYMAQVSLLAVSGNLVIDLDTQAALSLQIAGNTTIANPEHAVTQKEGRIMFAASAVHTLSWGSAWKSTSAVTLPTATIDGATIVLDYVCLDGTMYPRRMFTIGLVLSNTDVAPLASLSATGSASTGTLANLVDGNNSTLASYNGGTPPAFIFDFGVTPRNLWKLRLGLNAGTVNPMLCRLVYSDDGSTWTVTNQASISKALESAITDHTVDNYGAHRYWALQALSGPWIQFTTVEMYPRIGG